MSPTDNLKALVKAVGGEITDELATILLDDARVVFTTLTNRKQCDKFPNCIVRIAFTQWQMLGDEAKTNYSAGGVSVSFNELEKAVKPYLPTPIANTSGRVFECVDTKSTV